MSISQAIRDGLASRGAFHDRVEQFVAGEGGLTVRCEVRDAESLGCALTQVELVSDVPSSLSTKVLAAQADRLCKRVTYLMEPLRLIELDSRSSTVLVRSETPRRKGDVLSYYEFLCDSHRHTTLRRYSLDQAVRKRCSTEFVLTPEQLERLVEDIVDVAGAIN